MFVLTCSPLYEPIVIALQVATFRWSVVAFPSILRLSIKQKKYTGTTLRGCQPAD